jgi:hypothetical protein
MDIPVGIAHRGIYLGQCPLLANPKGGKHQSGYCDEE